MFSHSVSSLFALPIALSLSLSLCYCYAEALILWNPIVNSWDLVTVLLEVAAVHLL